VENEILSSIEKNNWNNFVKSIESSEIIKTINNKNVDVYCRYFLDLIKLNISNKIIPDVIKSIKGGFKGYGGCGTTGTMHEIMFHFMHPELNFQVSFGTRKNGVKKYGTKCFTVDFYDPDNLICYEIDGENHQQKNRFITDAIKEVCLSKEYNIKTIRITNQDIENMCQNRIKSILLKGVRI
jgi:hypothetical protein